MSSARGVNNKETITPSEMQADSPERVFTCQYLEKNSGKKDLLRRLRTIVQTLREEEDLEHDDYPGLDALSRLMVKPKFLEHKDKEVRLYSVLACVEIFYVYAPEAPFDEQETIIFFTQMVRQLGNLAHCTSPKQPNYLHYFHLLEQLATVRIGVVLVELCRTMEDCQEALDTLVELVRTLLELVHIDHAQQVVNHAATAVASILEEFDASIPTPILDEVLQCIASGPVIMVTNPAFVEAAAKKYKPTPMPPMQIQQTNPSYLVAANAIRKVGEKVASPISSFLNGLWNGDPCIVEQTSISTDDATTPNVWATIYELHKIAPPILTTVIGTVSASLTAPEEDMRIKVVKLLGRLFYSQSSNIGTQFSPCFREWLRRHVDVSVQVRQTMAKYLVTILSNDKKDLVDETTTTLQHIICHDPDTQVRISAIHQVCDMIYKNPSLGKASLLQAVGDRVSSKSKNERRDALTGLAQIYHKHYMTPKLAQVETGGDDVAIEIVMDTLHAIDEETDDKYGWIARKVFECASFQDDFEMRNRVVQIIDEVFLGRFSGTSRAVGLALILQSLDKPSNAHSWMTKLLMQRATMQSALAKYLSARSKVRRCKAGTEEALLADAHAMECLETVASLIGSSTSPVLDTNVLEKLHAARDNHIFKILATICSATHSTSARSRALEELPKRCKSLGDATATFVRTLARRTAMGHFCNVDVIRNVILLAQECLNEGDYEGSSMFLFAIKSVTDIFPSLCANKEDFGNLLELFTECRSISNPKAKKQAEQLQMVTTVSSIVASTAQAIKSSGIDSELESQLLNLCTRDGTPEQARHAVQIMAALLVDKNADNATQEEAFVPLLKALSSPSKLNISSGSRKVVGSLAALSALAERVPSLFTRSGRGVKALRFALETILLGRRDSFGSVDSDGEIDEEDVESDAHGTPNSSAKKRRKSNQSPGTKNTLEDDHLNIACRRACAAIEFLVIHIRSSIFKEKDTKPSSEHISQVFDVLYQILKDQGLPPSSRDRKDCKARQDRAALRECASVNLFRLCDARLKLADVHLSNGLWHTLSASLLDEEKRVRELIMAELCSMLTGRDAYGEMGAPMPANLRFVAMVVLCVDMEGGSLANGNAASVGKGCQNVKQAARVGIVGLRRTAEATLNQSRALGKENERYFEAVLKKQLMPEYSVPYAIHLLSLRRETPSAGGVVVGIPGSTQLAATQSSDDQSEADDSSRHKVLRKRLKWLFEPLVLSLGDTADNISFLLRMTGMIGSQFQPIDVLSYPSNFVLSADSDDSLASPIVQKTENTVNMALYTAQMKTVCAAARDVLLTFVKKDVNLTPYPGQIEVPTSIFKKLTLSTIKASQRKQEEISTPVNISKKRISKPKSPASQESLDGSLDVIAKSLRSSTGSQSNESSHSLSTHSTRSRRKERESIDTFESAGTNSKSDNHARESLDSSSTATMILSQDTGSSVVVHNRPRRSSRNVTFSPEVVARDVHDDFGGDMSPILGSDSPASIQSTNNRDSLSVNDEAAGSASPSVPRAALSRPLDLFKPSTRSPRKRKSVSSQESEVPPATKTSKSEDEYNDPVSPPKRRKPAPVKIKMGLSQSSGESSTRSSSIRGRRKTNKKLEEFDFDDNVLNATEKKNHKMKDSNKELSHSKGKKGRVAVKAKGSKNSLKGKKSVRKSGTPRA